MTKKTKEPRIINKIKREVAKEKARAKDQNKPISSELSCSGPASGVYCSE